jgi:hypothetical protein
VLLMRFWHPGTTPTEREALQYIFDALDGPEAQMNLDFDYLNSIAEAQLAARCVRGRRPDPTAQEKSERLTRLFPAAGDRRVRRSTPEEPLTTCPTLDVLQAPTEASCA